MLTHKNHEILPHVSGMSLGVCLFATNSQNAFYISSKIVNSNWHQRCVCVRSEQSCTHQILISILRCLFFQSRNITFPLHSALKYFFCAVCKHWIYTRSTDSAVDVGFYHLGSAWFWTKRKTQVNKLNSTARSDDALSTSGGGAKIKTELILDSVY